MNEEASLIKVCLLGQSSVGKSSLVLRFVQEKFFPITEGTIGAAFLSKVITIDDSTIKFEIWDTAGQERYHSLAPIYYRSAHAAIIVFDITSLESFEKAQDWVEELKEKSNPEQVIALAGNKSDLPDRAVEQGIAEKFAKQNNLLYFETSAKSGENVFSLFEQLARRVPKHLHRTASIQKFLPPLNEEPSKGCRC